MLDAKKWDDLRRLLIEAPTEDLTIPNMEQTTPALSRPEFRLPRSHEAFARANRVIPGGVNSPARAFGGVGGEPPFIARAVGAYLHDIDGHSYIDYVGSWGPMILGHVHPAVNAAVTAALDSGRASVRRPRGKSRSPSSSPVRFHRSRRSGSSRREPRRPCRPSAWPAA